MSNEEKTIGYIVLVEVACEGLYCDEKPLTVFWKKDEAEAEAKKIGLAHDDAHGVVLEVDCCGCQA